MSSITDQVGQQVTAGRQVMDRTFHLVEKQVGPIISTRRARIASGALLATAVALGLGMLAYRRRRRRTLASRIQQVLPDELVARAKRALG
jgi:hypothetical protein